MSDRLFRYSALDGQGKETHGTLEAPSSDQAMTLLARRDLVVQDLREVTRGASVPAGAQVVSAGDRSVPVDELASFSYELSALIQAGVPLPQALELQVKDQTKGRMDSIVVDLLQQVRAGTPFSTAVQAHPNVFPPVYSALIRSGEGTGSVDKALEQLSEFFEKIDEVRNRILSALSYPVVVSGMALVILTALFIFMVPRFEQIYQSIGVPVPAATQMVLDAGQYADEAAVVFVILVVVGTPLVRRLLSTPGGRLAADRWKLRAPLLGDVFMQVALANFSKTLALLHKNGVNLPSGVELAAAASGNTWLRERFAPAVSGLRAGSGLSEALRPTGLFSEKMLGMLEAGEKSGNLSEMLLKLAEFTENRTQHRVDRVLALLEPLTIGFIGLAVGTAVITLGAPLMSISSAIQQQ